MMISEIKVGDRVGRWVVLCEQNSAPRSSRKWLCRCDCGTERAVLERNLRYGTSLSCGCLRKVRHQNEAVSSEVRAERADRTQGKKKRYSDISGQRFGHLVALCPSREHDKSGFLVWRCRCDCGTEVNVSYNSLLYGNQVSCGCQKKEHDRKLNTYLTHVAGTSVDMLKSTKIPKDNTTGYKGVYLVRGKYLAKIVFQKKQYVLGIYERIEDAAEARKEAEEILFVGVAAHYEKWKARAALDPNWARANPVQVIVSQADGQLKTLLLPDLSANESSAKEYRCKRSTTTRG